jgi:predicted RNA binding protein with dsRBD fold (UPF0201 family)
MFGEIEMVEADGEFTAELDDYMLLRELRSRIATDKIRDTMSDILTRWTEDDLLSFGLNRQAAYNGHVSLTLENEDPMGPINVVIEGDVRRAITYLTS